MSNEEQSLFADQTPPDQWITVANAYDFAEGQGKAFALGNRMVAVFLHQGQFYAIDDFCPHQGASLAEGYVNECIVACPWHHWRFSLADGKWIDNPKLGVDKFSVRVLDGKVQVQAPDNRTSKETQKCS